MRKHTLFAAILSVAVVAFLGGSAMAFHDQGVAHCNGCHTMHNSVNNPADNAGGNDFLLQQGNSTDQCLSCHATRLGNSWGTAVDNPGNVYGGGQFVFLLEDNLNDGHAGSDPSNYIDGEKAGHSVISLDFGTVRDTQHAAAPGGTVPAYSSANMHCTSCHDPHGEGGHFRLLYGNGEVGDPADQSSSESFAFGYFFDYTNPAPQAIGAALFGAGESNSNHTAYIAGMSEWCGNCHGDYHVTNYPTVLKHPSGVAIGGGIAGNYNRYEGTGTYTGDGTDAYLAMVPFEDSSFDGTDQDYTDYVGPAAGGSRVMCLTCHRAHASSGPSAGRWDFNITIWADEGVESGSYVIPNPYAATAGDHQRSLCNKCHAKDPELN